MWGEKWGGGGGGEGVGGVRGELGCLINSRINSSSTELYMEVIFVLQPHGGLAPLGGNLTSTNITRREGEEGVGENERKKQKIPVLVCLALARLWCGYSIKTASSMGHLG